MKHLATIWLFVIVCHQQLELGQSEDCPMLQASDLGNTTALSASGFLADALAFETGDNALTYQLLEYNTVCLAQGDVRDMYRFVSVIVTYLDSNGTEDTRQLYLQCNFGAWDTTNLGRDERGISMAGGNLTTPLRTDCYFCAPPIVDARISIEDGCFACEPGCTGLMRCTGPTIPQQRCCNFFDMTGACVVACPPNSSPNAQFDCECNSGYTPNGSLCVESNAMSTSNVSVPALTSVGEGGGTVLICVMLRGGGMDQDLNLTLSTNDGTALAGLDYLSVSSSLVFPANSTDRAVQCQNIVIIDDFILESEESFTVTITTSNPNVVLGNNITIVSIADNEVLTATINSSKPLSVLLGDYISLSCSSNSHTNEELAFTWTHLNTSTILDQTSGTLTFPHVSLEQLGTYACTISVLSMTSTAEVTISGARPLINAGAYPGRVFSGSCPSTSREDTMLDVLQLLASQFGVRPLGLIQSYPAMSCDQVRMANPDSLSGMYWIGDTDSQVQVHCEF